MSPEEQPVTAALRAWRGGDARAEEELMRLVYPELHRRARRLLAGERPDHTLQPTALIGELYLRLVDQRSSDWNDRAHLFAIAARLMRRVILDYARKHGAGKRGGGRRNVPLELAGEIAVATASDLAELEALDEALAELARQEATAAAVVELRFFGGLTVEETAAALELSTATVGRQWRMARAWLHDRPAATSSTARRAGAALAGLVMEGDSTRSASLTFGAC